MLTRRGLFSLAAPLVMAPAIIRYSKIMPVKVWRKPRVWQYRTSDPLEVITADGYFDRFPQIAVGDNIEVVRVQWVTTVPLIRLS